MKTSTDILIQMIDDEEAHAKHCTQAGNRQMAILAEERARALAHALERIGETVWRGTFPLVGHAVDYRHDGVVALGVDLRVWDSKKVRLRALAPSMELVENIRHVDKLTLEARLTDDNIISATQHALITKG